MCVVSMSYDTSDIVNSDATDGTSTARTGTSRRRVLQGLGGLSVAGLAGVGSARSQASKGRIQAQMGDSAIGSDPAILVFSATTEFRHNSIPEGNQAIQELATEIGNENDVDFTVNVIESDASQFPANAGELSQYDLVVWNSTTGDVLNDDQQAAFKQYIQSGGGYMGIHAAADTEYDWEWYGGLVGAYFSSHPSVQEAEVHVTDRTHPSTSHLPAVWTRTDEWYDYQENPRGDVHVLAALDESTYENEGMDGIDHPIAWAQYYDGARSFYTGGGHTDDSYDSRRFRQHLKGGMMWAAGYIGGGASGTVWDNYEKIPLDTDTQNPAMVDIASDGRVFYIERGDFGGGEETPAEVVMINQENDNEISTVLDLTVYAGQEDGLLGILLDSDFENTGWVYLYYSPTNDEIDGPHNRLSRFTMEGDTIDPDSEVEILRIPTQRETCCHTGGDMHWGPGGEQLYLTTGDDTNPFESSGYAPIDERDGRKNYDSQRTAANTNDLRGKILRIIPQEDGSYTVPDSNLFPGDSSGGGGSDSDAIEPGTTIELGGEISGWIGEAPSSIEGETNPTLTLQEGATYTVAFENLDGAPHDFYMLDENESELVGTELVTGQGGTASVEFEATAEMVEYYCSVHPFQMRGDVAIEEGDSGGGGGNAKPEIYTMGNRNPYRAAVDQETGTLYWGDYGPDAGSWNAERGPLGIVEFNRANEPGFYGWPYFVGPDIPYIDYDFETEESGDPFDPDSPVNESPNNDGLTDLPSSQEAMIYYSGASWEDLLDAPEYAQEYLPDEPPFPQLQGGAPMAGPVFRYQDNYDSDVSLPESFDGKFFIMEWNENWIKYVSFDDDGNVMEIDPFLPDMEFLRPMDMKVGPDGALYLIEWGSGFGGPNNDSGVYRIEHSDDGGSDGPPVIGDSDSAPTDPDDDGLYEDLDGDGKVTEADGELFFEHIDDPEMQNNVEAFDFNGNGRLDFDDIVEWRKKKNS